VRKNNKNNDLTSTIHLLLSPPRVFKLSFLKKPME